MAEEMSEIQRCLSENRDKIEKVLDTELYRHEHFNVPFSLAVYTSDVPGYVSTLAAQIRKTDIFIALDEHYAAVVYAHADLEAGVKACQAALLSFASLHPHNRLYAGVTSVESVHTDQDIVTRAFYALNHAKQDRFSAVEDDSAISSVAHTRHWF